MEVSAIIEVVFEMGKERNCLVWFPETLEIEISRGFFFERRDRRAPFRLQEYHSDCCGGERDTIELRPCS